MKYLSTLSIVFCLSFSAATQTVTYSEHIAPIIYKHCTNCHRTGEIAPFPLTKYEEVRDRADFIEYVTAIRYMPPWKPEIGYQDYLGENYLSDAEIQLISDWVEQGSLRGDPSLEPPLPVFPSGSQVGTPDLVVSFAEAYKHEGNDRDEYRYFVIPTGLEEDKDLIALEIRPGNKKIVHHTLIWQDTTGQSIADDLATPEYGYEDGSGSVFSSINDQLPGYVPGQRPHVYTKGIGMKLYKNSALKLQMHYAPVTTDEWDSTSINLFFADKPVNRYVKSYVMLPIPGVLQNGPFIIPANEVREFHGQIPVIWPVSMIGIAPHMHLLGQHWKVYAVKPNNDTVPLININEWDFNWQGTFAFKRLIPLPSGTTIHAYAKYDNTEANPLNPNFPPQSITWGENTSDEMYYLPLLYLDYQPGDENIVFEDPTTAIEDEIYTHAQDRLYPVAPNPSEDEIRIGYTLSRGEYVTLRIYDLNGTLIDTPLDRQFCLPGMHIHTADISALPFGIYLLTMETPGKVRQVQKIVVGR